VADFDDELKEIHKEMEGSVRGFFPQRTFQIPGEAWSPPMDVYETDTELVIILEVAGAGVGDLRILFDRRWLRISGIRESTATSSHTKCHQMEIGFGSFHKEILVPFEIDRERAISHYKDGLLKITLPKTTRESKRSIDIEAE
jgi:HSP20 family protein